MAGWTKLTSHHVVKAPSDLREQAVRLYVCHVAGLAFALLVLRCRCVNVLICNHFCTTECLCDAVRLVLNGANVINDPRNLQPLLAHLLDDVQDAVRIDSTVDILGHLLELHSKQLMTFLRIADLLRHCAHLIPHSLDFLDLPLAFALAPLHSRLDISESAHLCAGVNDVGGRSGELVAGIW